MERGRREEPNYISRSAMRLPGESVSNSSLPNFSRREMSSRSSKLIEGLLSVSEFLELESHSKRMKSDSTFTRSDSENIAARNRE